LTSSLPLRRARRVTGARVSGRGSDERRGGSALAAASLTVGSMLPLVPLSDGLPARRFPVVTVALIPANLAVWILYELPDLEGAIAQAMTLGFSPDADARIPMLGASGAISAVLGAFLALHPHARIKTLVLVFVVQISVWVYLGGWLLYQLVEAHYALVGPSEEGSGVAFFAHIGGCVFGWIVARALLDTRRIHPQSTARPSALAPL
jgi:hypothetical protein